jgi:tetratricopeptide (TPR) repeat protein
VGQEADEAFNRGNALAARGRHAEAEAAYREALRHAPKDFEAISNLAGCLKQLGRLDEAIALYGTALALQPREAPLHANLSAALHAAGRPEEAVASLRRLLEIEPPRADARRNRGWQLLSLGRFAEGWAEYRWRASGAAPQIPPRGSPVHLAGVAGLGDTLFFLRFAARLAGPLTAHVDARLVALLERSRLFARVVPQESPAAGAVPVADLPALIGMSRAEDAPPPLPLAARADLRAALKAELAALGPAPYLGVLWRSGTRDLEGALLKQLPAEMLGAALRGVPGTVLVLQREAEPGELERFAAALGREAHDVSGAQSDLERLLALLDLIEHYIGVSSTAVHLLAGLGRTARVLVPMPPEWRWMAAGAASPWFPGSRIYRQGIDGSWRAALDALARELA